MAGLLAASVLVAGLFGQPAKPDPVVIPYPMEMTKKPGEFEILPSTQIVATGEALEVANSFANYARVPTGYPLSIRPTKPIKDYIEFEVKDELKWLGPEGYRINVRETFISIRSATPQGLFYGVQSLRQLLPHSIESKEAVFTNWKVPGLDITDMPRFSWRGLMLDESRHFFGQEKVKKLIDTLALYKINRFHWHLVDDGGWRVEIKKYPELTKIGAWRAGDGRGWNNSDVFFHPNDGIVEVYGGFYTQDQIRDVVAYAAERNVEIVPEIEMPGHSLPALWVNRELACDDATLNKLLPNLPYQFANVYCAGNEKTYEFLEGVLDEVCELFPGKYVHIGGDEVDQRAWQTCTKCVDRRIKERLNGTDELQSYFVSRMASYLKSKGKVAIGWDEILEGGKLKDAAVMSWRGTEGGTKAINQGFAAVMSPTSHCYFDYSYATTPVEKVYGFDPMPPKLTVLQQALLLGAQGNIWTERMESFDRVEEMVFPRVLALSEALWTPSKLKSFARFQKNLPQAQNRLNALGVNYHGKDEERQDGLIGSRILISGGPPSGEASKLASFFAVLVGLFFGGHKWSNKNREASQLASG
ncbi:MAG: beta-N-acetylhexosaminidase [Fimbriimonadaceae bacterium]|nr:beta-N-acetylhexosaminidase [Fimbriimonadaceae bacterium]